MTPILTQTGQYCFKPFSISAVNYHELGLSIFPCGKENGKMPLIKSWKPFQKQQASIETVEHWLDTYGNANIAIVTGQVSGITVLDCDDQNKSVYELFQLFGETPIVIQTPRGGYHLYYKSNGEGIQPPTLPNIDIRGNGGYIVAPPSYNSVSNASYKFLQGDIGDFKSLPFIKPEYLGNHCIKQQVPKEGLIGQRNNNLFRYLLEKASCCVDYKALFVVATEFNNIQNVPPLPINEVSSTTKSVWGYKLENKLFIKGKFTICVDYTRLQELSFNHSNAMSMYLDLLNCHKDRHPTFAIVVNKYAKRSGWSAHTVRDNIKILLKSNLIAKVHNGGKYRGDPSLYKLI